jgi:sugar phosphate permease
MKTTTLCILAGICGVIFAITVRNMGMSPAQYMLDNYGWVGLLIYAIIGLGVAGFLLYHAGKIQNEQRKQTQAKE